MLGYLRDDGVAEGPKSVHPSGNPMSHSTHVGFSCPPTASRRVGPYRPAGSYGVPSGRKFRARLEVGVGHNATASSRLRRPSVKYRRAAVSTDGMPQRSARLAVGVGQVPVRAMVSSDGRTDAPGLGLWLEPKRLAAGVGNHEDPITSVRGAEGGRGYAIPLRVIPDRGQVPEYVSDSPAKETRYVLQHRPLRS